MDKTIIDNGFYILRYKNDGDEILKYQEAVSQEFIQFHFCQKGSGNFEFNGGSYQLPLMSKNVILLYNPQKTLPIDLNLTPDSAVVSLVISIKKFHSLFSEDADHIHFLSAENNTKKYYDTRPISPAMSVVLSQILETKLHESIQTLYFKGKVYELAVTVCLNSILKKEEKPIFADIGAFVGHYACYVSKFLKYDL